MLSSSHNRGDTIIEVLLAATIFSMVAVAGLTIMNQGSAAAQRSLEVTLVRHEMDAQAEALRLLYDESVAQRAVVGAGGGSSSAVARWNEVLGRRVAAASSFSSMADDDGISCLTPPDRAFVVNTRTLSALTPVWQQPAVYSRVLYDAGGNAVERAEGLWVEAVEGGSATGTPGYTDFHIRACWSTIGQSQPVTLGTIVRLYEP